MAGIEDDIVICCFCGKQLPQSRAALLVAYPPTAGRDESQELFCHGKCLREVISEAIPLHPDLDD